MGPLSCLSACDVGVLWPNGLTNQDETWHAGSPGHIVLDGDPAPPPPKGHSPPIFGPYPLRPNGCIDQDATWYGGRPGPGRLCVKWGPSPTPNFRPMFIIVIVISLEHCTGVRRYCLFKFKLSFSILWFLFLESLIVLSLSNMHSSTT